MLPGKKEIKQKVDLMLTMERAIDRWYKEESKHLLHFLLQPSLDNKCVHQAAHYVTVNNKGKISRQKSSDMSQLESR